MRTGREAGAGAFAFLEVSDGSCFGNIQACGPGWCPRARPVGWTCLGMVAGLQRHQLGLQVMVTKEVAEAVGGLKAIISTGTSVLVEGQLTETPPGTKQARPPLHRACVLRACCLRLSAVLGSDARQQVIRCSYPGTASAA